MVIKNKCLPRPRKYTSALVGETSSFSATSLASQSAGTLTRASLEHSARRAVASVASPEAATRNDKNYLFTKLVGRKHDAALYKHKHVADTPSIENIWLLLINNALPSPGIFPES